MQMEAGSPFFEPLRRAPSPSGPASPFSRREKSGRAGGIKGGTGKPHGRSHAAMSPFPLVRRGVGWWSCGDSNPGPSHCEGVTGPLGHRSMRCMSCELTARAPRCRPRGAPGGHANCCQLCDLSPRRLLGLRAPPCGRRGDLPARWWASLVTEDVRTSNLMFRWMPAFRPSRAVSYGHVHALRAAPHGADEPSPQSRESDVP